MLICFVYPGIRGGGPGGSWGPGIKLGPNPGAMALIPSMEERINEKFEHVISILKKSRIVRQKGPQSQAGGHHQQHVMHKQSNILMNKPARI
jgi:hypothetical protein